MFILFLTAQAVLDALKADALRKQLDRDKKAFKIQTKNENRLNKKNQDKENKLKVVYYPLYYY